MPQLQPLSARLMLLHLGPQTAEQPDLHPAPQTPAQAPLDTETQALSQAVLGISARALAGFAEHDASQDCFRWTQDVFSQSDTGTPSHFFPEEEHECSAGADG